MDKVTRLSVPSKTTRSEGHPLVSIALFSALGLLVSLVVLMASHSPIGDWY